MVRAILRNQKNIRKLREKAWIFWRETNNLINLTTYDLFFAILITKIIFKSCL